MASAVRKSLRPQYELSPGDRLDQKEGRGPSDPGLGIDPASAMPRPSFADGELTTFSPQSVTYLQLGQLVATSSETLRSR